MSPCFTVADIQGPHVRRVLNPSYVPMLTLTALTLTPRSGIDVFAETRLPPDSA